MSSNDQDPREPQAAGNEIAAVSVHSPPHWDRNPVIWFLKAEPQFAPPGVASQERKFFRYVAPPASAAEEVAGVIVACFVLRNPPPAAAYDQLEAARVERTAASERTRMQLLLPTEELGDRRPRQCLQRMTQLLGSRAQARDDALLRELFLQRLPANVQMVLAASMDLTSLASLADKVMDPQVASLSGAPPAPWYGTPPVRPYEAHPCRPTNERQKPRLMSPLTSKVHPRNL